MENQTRTEGCLAFTVPGVPTAEAAAALLRRELSARGLDRWPAAEIRLFPGRSESLLLARPAKEPRMYISAAALAVLAAHFDMEDY